MPRVRRRPDEPLRLALIGTGNRGWENLEEIRHERIVALCDVDRGLLGRARAGFPEASTFADFRELIADARELDLDGVVVATPDSNCRKLSAGRSAVINDLAGPVMLQTVESAGITSPSAKYH